MRYRLGALFVVVGLVLATLSIQVASAGGPTLTRVRIELSGTSDWQIVSLSDSWIGAYHVVSQTPGSTVERGYNSLMLKGVAGSSLATTIDVLMEIHDATETSFVVTLSKGKLGTTTTKLYRTNAGSVHFATLTNTKTTTTTGEYKVVGNVPVSSYVGEGYTIPRVDPRRLVLAFYYPWFQAGSFDSGPWWDEPSPGTAYDTNVSAEIAKQLDLAKESGVDGFVVSWDDIGNHTDRFDKTLSAASVRSMVVAPLIELLVWETSSGFNVAGIVETIKLALERSDNSAYLKVAGRPVIFTFGAYEMNAEVWKSVRQAVAAAGHDPFYVGEPLDSSYGFHGAYFYNPNGYDWEGLVWKNGAYKRSLRYSAQVNPAVKQRLWAATVSPGQNFSYKSPLFPKHVDRKDGDRYDLAWGAAVSSDPEWVLITSWNEWYEATHIVPSKKFGWTAIQQTAGWSAGFHNPSPSGAAPPAQGGLLPNLNLPLKFAGKK